MRSKSFAAWCVTLCSCQGFLVFDRPDVGDTPPSDAGDSSDASLAAQGASPCDGATFCDDFDEGPLGAKWDRVRDEAGLLSLTPEGRSAPYGLRVRRGDAAPASFLSKSLGVTGDVSCSFAVLLRPVNGPRSGYFDLFWVELTAPGYILYALRFGMHDKNNVWTGNVREDISYADGGSELPARDTLTYFEPPPMDAWERVTVTTNFATVSVRYGERTIIDASRLKGPAPTSVRVQIGARGSSGDPAEALLDDFECTTAR